MLKSPRVFLDVDRPSPTLGSAVTPEPRAPGPRVSLPTELCLGFMFLADMGTPTQGTGATAGQPKDSSQSLPRDGRLRREGTPWG